MNWRHKCTLLHPKGCADTRQGTDLNAETKAALPTAGAPKVMQRTSAVGQFTAAQVASRVATEPPIQKPTVAMRRGRVSPVHSTACHSLSQHTRTCDSLVQTPQLGFPAQPVRACHNV